ncbi:MAG: glycosyl hydrolase family 2 [Prevotella sp.]|nr:glycosyl hydrolase family 2 [Prevotella sp.]
MKRLTIALCFAALHAAAFAQSWPTPATEAKPGVRWWWLGSAVDKKNLQWTMREYAKHGIGAVEITPLYGVQGNEKNNIPYLSDKWMDMLRFTQSQGRLQDIEIDMATGTGWPFGGPWVPLEESACKVLFVDTAFTGKKVEQLELLVPEKDRKYAKLQKVMAYPQATGNKAMLPKAIDVTSAVQDGKLTWQAPKGTKKRDEWRVIAVYVRYGVMKVKRAAPGGEGLVIDHFDRTSVANYLRHIEQAFERTNTPYPHTFFNDSYEVSEATWTPTLFEEFEKRRGYKLQDYLPQLLDSLASKPKNLPKPSPSRNPLIDYRETLGDLLLENFTEQWTAWAHSHGAITRNQAHGSPANLIDCYAAVDIPEIEGFGLSDFGIKGLRTDPGKTRKNDSDYSMFKYAPSAAHVCGKPYTSSETFTWLTEHFRTSLSQLKPDLDLMFCAGVNHMFFHGTCYSPQDDPWPGWKFYASIDMSPTNSIWRDAPYFMKYVERCQSFLQWGQPDNDFLVLLPVRDMWEKNPNKLLMQFSIHAMGKLAPEFIRTILDIDRAGFDCDYISERLLMDVNFTGGMLQTKGGTRYRGLIIPGSGNMPEGVKAHIAQLKAQGAHVFYSTDAGELAKAAKPETMKTQYGLKAVRRTNPTGHHYFIANLTPEDINAGITLAVGFKDALWFDPLTGNRYLVDRDGDNVKLALRSGQSMILQTFDSETTLPTGLTALPDAMASNEKEFPLSGPWTLTFTDESPRVAKTFALDTPQTWETLDDDSVGITMGTGIYTTHRKLTKEDLKNATSWTIDLGDVRESARVYINGQFVGCAWSVPFVLDCKNTLKEGDNEVRIEVTNLPANRIADLDRRGVKWRKMEEINVVDINYKKTTYGQWEPVPSGLNSNVRLIKRQ